MEMLDRCIPTSYRLGALERGSAGMPPEHRWSLLRGGVAFLCMECTGLRTVGIDRWLFRRSGRARSIVKIMQASPSILSVNTVRGVALFLIRGYRRWGRFQDLSSRTGDRQCR